MSSAARRSAGYRWLFLMVVVTMTWATAGVMSASAVDGSWVHIVELTDPNASNYDSFGTAVAIEAVYANGITAGCSVGPLRFCPDDDVSRAEITAFLLRVLDEDGDLASYHGLFPDVPDGVWYAPVEKAAQLELVGGYVDGTFGPARPLTRAEMAVVVIRALGEPDPPVPVVNPFTDVHADAWHAPFVHRLKELGIATGYSDGTYWPLQNVTRAEVAALFEWAWDLTMP